MKLAIRVWVTSPSNVSDETSHKIQADVGPGLVTATPSSLGRDSDLPTESFSDTTIGPPRFDIEHLCYIAPNGAIYSMLYRKGSVLYSRCYTSFSCVI